MKSILHERDGTCYLCASRGNYRHYPVLHEHHVFGGANRKVSERTGLKVWLCPQCHVLGNYAVHKDQSINRELQQTAQRAYEQTHTRIEFMLLFGRNYL